MKITIEADHKASEELSLSALSHNPVSQERTESGSKRQRKT